MAQVYDQIPHHYPPFPSFVQVLASLGKIKRSEASQAEIIEACYRIPRWIDYMRGLLDAKVTKYAKEDRTNQLKLKAEKVYADRELENNQKALRLTKKAVALIKWENALSSTVESLEKSIEDIQRAIEEREAELEQIEWDLCAAGRTEIPFYFALAQQRLWLEYEDCLPQVLGITTKERFIVTLGSGIQRHRAVENLVARLQKMIAEIELDWYKFPNITLKILKRHEGTMRERQREAMVGASTEKDTAQGTDEERRKRVKVG